MLDTLLSLFAPHYCYGCGEVGYVLCPYCVNDIMSEPYAACILCRKPAPQSGICGPCRTRTGIESAICIGERRQLLRTVLDAFKFERAQAVGTTLGDVLTDCSSVYDQDWVVTAIPSTSAHIRARGYDHARVVATRFARRRSLAYAPLLIREDSAVQHTANKATRYRQAARAFSVTPEVPDKVILIDDIITTGATVEAAARMLRVAGASHIALGVIARQPLDEMPDL